MSHKTEDVCFQPPDTSLEDEPRFGVQLKSSVNEVIKAMESGTRKPSNNGCDITACSPSVEKEKVLPGNELTSEISCKIAHADVTESANALKNLVTVEISKKPTDSIGNINSNRKPTDKNDCKLVGVDFLVSSEDMNSSGLSQSSTETSLNTTIRHNEVIAENGKAAGKYKEIECKSQTNDGFDSDQIHNIQDTTESRSAAKESNTALNIVPTFDEDFQATQLPAIHNFFPDANFNKYNEYLQKQDPFDPRCLEQAASHDSSGYISAVSIVKDQGATHKDQGWLDTAEHNNQVSTQANTASLSSESSFNSDFSESTNYSVQDSPELARVKTNLKQGGVQGNVNEENIEQQPEMFSVSSVNIKQVPLCKEGQNPKELHHQDQVLIEINDLDRKELEQFMANVTLVESGCGPSDNQVVAAKGQDILLPQAPTTQPRSGNMIHLEHWQSMPLNSMMLNSGQNSAPQATQTGRTNYQEADRKIQHCQPAPTPITGNKGGVNMRKIQVVCNNNQQQASPGNMPKSEMYGSGMDASVGSCSTSQYGSFYETPLLSPFMAQNPVHNLASPTQLVAGSYNSQPVMLNNNTYRRASVHHTVQSTILHPPDQVAVSVNRFPGQRTVDYIDSLLMTCDASNYAQPISPYVRTKSREPKPPKEAKVKRIPRRSRGVACQTQAVRTPDQELEFIRSYQNQRNRGGGRPRRSASMSVGIQCNGETIDETSRWLQDYCGNEGQEDVGGFESPELDPAWEYASESSYNYNYIQVEADMNNNSTAVGPNMSILPSVSRGGLCFSGSPEEEPSIRYQEEEEKRVISIQSPEHAPVGMQLAQQIAKVRPNTIVKYSEQFIQCHDNKEEEKGLAVEEQSTPAEEVVTPPRPGDVTMSTEATLSCPVSGTEHQSQDEGSGPHRGQDRPDADDVEVQVESCNENPIPDELNQNQPSLQGSPQLPLATSDIITSVMNSPVVSSPYLKMQMLCQAAMQSPSPATPQQLGPETILRTSMTPIVDVLNTPEVTAALNDPTLRSPPGGSEEKQTGDGGPETTDTGPLLIDEDLGTSLKRGDGRATELEGPVAAEESDLTEYDEEHRFEDLDYVTSFIKSFRTNPRRYKVYPEASLYKKTPFRPKKYTKQHTKRQPGPGPQSADKHNQSNEELQGKNMRMGRVTRASKSEGQQVSELLKYISGLNGQVKKLNKTAAAAADRRPRRRNAHRQRTKPLDLSNKPKKPRRRRKVKVTSSETSVNTRASTGSTISSSSSSCSSDQSPAVVSRSESRSKCAVSSPPSPPSDQSRPVSRGAQATKSHRKVGEGKTLKRKRSDMDVTEMKSRKKVASSQRKVKASATERCLRSSTSTLCGGEGSQSQRAYSHTHNQPLDLSTKRPPSPDEDLQPEDLSTSGRSQRQKTVRTLLRGLISRKPRHLAGRRKSPSAEITESIGSHSDTGGIGQKASNKRKRGRPGGQASASTEAVGTAATGERKGVGGGKQQGRRGRGRAGK